LYRFQKLPAHYRVSYGHYPPVSTPRRSIHRHSNQIIMHGGLSVVVVVVVVCQTADCISIKLLLMPE